MSKIHGKILKKVCSVLGVMILLLLIAGTMFYVEKLVEPDGQIDIHIENEEELLNVIFYELSSSEHTYLITLFDSGRLEIIQCARENDEIRDREGIREVKSRKNLLIEKTEVRELLRLAEEITNEKEVNSDSSDRDIILGAATYFRVTFQEKSFEIWLPYLDEEYRKKFEVEDEYDAYTYTKAFEFVKLIKELSAQDISFSAY